MSHMKAKERLSNSGSFHLMEQACPTIVSKIVVTKIRISSLFSSVRS